MKATTKGKAKRGSKAKSREAENLRELLVKVNRIRCEIKEISERPDLEDVLKATQFDEFTVHDIGCIDLPLHKIADGAAIAYARLVFGDE